MTVPQSTYTSTHPFLRQNHGSYTLHHYVMVAKSNARIKVRHLIHPHDALDTPHRCTPLTEAQ